MVRHDFAFPLGAAAHGGLYIGRSREGVVKASGGVGNQASRCNERGRRELATIVMAARGSEDGDGTSARELGGRVRGGAKPSARRWSRSSLGSRAS